MIDTLVYVTGNKYKFNIASKVFEDTNIKLIQRKIETPEIQSTSVEEIALFSAEWACKLLNQPVVVTDAGFYIEALKGFPGPFIKFVNQWFSVDDYLKLMENKDNRTIVVRDCLAFCKPNEKPISFLGEYRGSLAYKAGKASTTPIEQIYIPKGYTIPISEFTTEAALDYWGNSEILMQLKDYLFNS